MYKEFMYKNEKYIIDLYSIAYVNLYEFGEIFNLDIHFVNKSHFSLNFEDENDEEISRIYCLIRNWLIENK